MRIAETVALRSTCIDKQVGCVLVNDKSIILSTGYNGAPRKHTHCCDLGVCIKDEVGNPSACPSAHAEQNAILHCTDTQQIYAAYLTLSPCITCIRMLLNTSCRHIYFRQEHRHPEPKEMWIVSRGADTWHYTQQLEEL